MSSKMFHRSSVLSFRFIRKRKLVIHKSTNNVLLNYYRGTSQT